MPSSPRATSHSDRPPFSRYVGRPVDPPMKVEAIHMRRFWRWYHDTDPQRHGLTLVALRRRHMR